MIENLDLLREDRYYDLSDEHVLEALSFLVEQPGEHWAWTGRTLDKDTSSYPVFSVGKARLTVRLLILDLFVCDPVDKQGRSARTYVHCGRQSCVNPDHFRITGWRLTGRTPDGMTRKQQLRLRKRINKNLAKEPAKQQRKRNGKLPTKCRNGHAYEPDNYFYRKRKVDGKPSLQRACCICAQANSTKQAQKRKLAKEQTGYEDGGQWKAAARALLDSV